MRRQFSLPAEDLEWLELLERPFELVNEGGALRVILCKVPLPHGYTATEVTINVRIESGYPDAQLDMAYFYPPLERSDGKAIAATSPDAFDGKTWQRWSRHRTPANPWRPGIDNLSTHYELIVDWLQRELSK